MVEIVYQPVKKVVIFEVIPYEKPEDLALHLVPFGMSGQPVILHWANGVVFWPVALPPASDKLMDEYLEGTIFWSAVSFALMPEYVPKITISLRTGGTFEIGVMDVSVNPFMIEVGSWLREFKDRISGKE
ncbi:MAG: hypothetical protein ACE5PM_01900 [Candidatus Hydrothermarchaeales archaeon]